MSYESRNLDSPHNRYETFCYLRTDFPIRFCKKIFILWYVKPRSGIKVVKLRGIQFVVTPWDLSVIHLSLKFIFHPCFIMRSLLSLNEWHIFPVMTLLKLDFYGSMLRELLTRSSTSYQVVVYSCIVLSFWPISGGY